MAKEVGSGGETGNFGVGGDLNGGGVGGGEGRGRATLFNLCPSLPNKFLQIYPLFYSREVCRHNKFYYCVMASAEN
jgi:hypothetical protein